jgi:hypothetical protein
MHLAWFSKGIPRFALLLELRGIQLGRGNLRSWIALVRRCGNQVQIIISTFRIFLSVPSCLRFWMHFTGFSLLFFLPLFFSVFLTSRSKRHDLFILHPYLCLQCFLNIICRRFVPYYFHVSSHSHML